MVLFARKLDEQEVAAVAAYYQQARGATTPAGSKQ
jgi:cytochrome c553